MSHIHSPLSQSPWVNSALRTEPAQTTFSAAQYQLAIHGKRLFSSHLFGWEDGALVLSPCWWWSSWPEVWVVLVRQTEELSLRIACIRRSPENDSDFRGTDRSILVAKSLSS